MTIQQTSESLAESDIYKLEQNTHVILLQDLLEMDQYVAEFKTWQEDLRSEAERGLLFSDFDFLSLVSTQDSPSPRKSTPHSINTFGHEETTREPEKQPRILRVCNLPKPSPEEMAACYELFKDCPTMLREVKNEYQGWLDRATREEANETFEIRSSTGQLQQ